MARDGKPGRDPLDKTSETILISVKLPKKLLEDVDGFFGKGKRSIAIRDGLELHLANQKRVRAKAARDAQPPPEEKET